MPEPRFLVHTNGSSGAGFPVHIGGFPPAYFLVHGSGMMEGVFLRMFRGCASGRRQNPFFRAEGDLYGWSSSRFLVQNAIYSIFQFRFQFPFPIAISASRSGSDSFQLQILQTNQILQSFSCRHENGPPRRPPVLGRAVFLFAPAQGAGRCGCAGRADCGRRCGDIHD